MLINDESVEELIAQAIEHNNRAGVFADPPVDPTLATAAAQLTVSLRKLQGGGMDAATEDACLCALEAFLLRQDGPLALRVARAVDAIVGALPCIESGTNITRLCNGLVQQVHADPDSRAVACKAGAEKQIRTLLESWPADGVVCIAAEALLFSLAFEQPDSAAAAAFLPACAGNSLEGDDEDMLELAAAMRKQNMGRPSGPTAQGTGYMGRSSGPTAQGASVAAEGVTAEGVAVEGVTAENEDVGMIDRGQGCCFLGPCCSGERTHPMPGCGHTVLCDACAMGLELMAKEMPPDGDLSLCTTWCPVCRGSEVINEVASSGRMMADLTAAATALEHDLGSFPAEQLAGDVWTCD